MVGSAKMITFAAEMKRWLLYRCMMTAVMLLAMSELVMADGKTYTVLSTAPYPWLQDEASVNQVTLFDDKSITDITQHEDGTVSFAFHATIDGIQLVKARAKTTGVYTLSGQKVRDDGQTEGLPRGVYVVDGLKVIH